ncbi:sugar ABC transporter ATP-binding protein [Sorangium sp. So ce726]|uniref:sugar ABC transporter ATP-binding protein n=1 Tax=Sorangium sp. So ce726 TaxID=3133319 RepID=UPI003F61321E
MSGEPLVRAVGIVKRYPGVTALDGVDFEVLPGEVHAIVGENGSGKSTLLGVISGAIRPDGGHVARGGRNPRVLQPGDPAESRAAGIAHAQQEPQIAPALSVAENVMMGAWPTRLGWVRWRELRRRAAEVLARIGVDLDVDAPAGQLPLGRRQLIEIARALLIEPRVLLLDEATSALTDDDVARLFGVVRALRDEGVGIALISHRLREVFELADRATVLRDGRVVGTVAVADTTERCLVSMMVGRDLASFWHKEAVPIGAPALVVRELRRGVLRDINLTVRQGEIVGLAGLVGAGRSALVRTLIGERRALAGEILVDGERVQIESPAHALRLGIACVPEDRKAQGIVPEWPVRMNASLVALCARAPWALISRGFDLAALKRGAGGMTVRAASVDQPVGRLSGGNQQKVVLAKNLAIAPRVLILDEPTRGIDVGAKTEIYAELAALARAGMGLLVVSSELPELLGVCDRIYVMFRGRIVAELPRHEATEERIAYYSTGAHEVLGADVDRR